MLMKQFSFCRMAALLLLMLVGRNVNAFGQFQPWTPEPVNVTFKLARMNATLAILCGIVELEQSEFNRALRECRMQVKHVIATAIVVLCAAVVAILRVIPNVSKFGHCCRLLAINGF